MTSDNQEKDNLLPEEAEGQDQSRVENTAVNQQPTQEENGEETPRNNPEPPEEKAEEPQIVPAPEETAENAVTAE